jgi:hypothetical protein
VAGRSPALVRETSFEQLAELLAQDYAINGRKTASNLSYRIAHLRGHFGKLTATEIGYDAMTRYISARMAEGAALATVKHELACLGRMLTLAVRSRRLAVKPRHGEGQPSRVHLGGWPADPLLPRGLGVSAGSCGAAGSDLPRPQAKRGSAAGARWRQRDRGNAPQWAQDASDLRPLQHREHN